MPLPPINYFIQPFANQGDKNSIPNTSMENLVNMEQGFTNAYETPLPPEGNGIQVNRADMNGILNSVTGNQYANQMGAVHLWQEFINDGTNSNRVVYSKGAIVWYQMIPNNPGSLRMIVSLKDGNSFYPKTAFRYFGKLINENQTPSDGAIDNLPWAILNTGLQRIRYWNVGGTYKYRPFPNTSTILVSCIGGGGSAATEYGNGSDGEDSQFYNIRAKGGYGGTIYGQAGSAGAGCDHFEIFTKNFISGQGVTSILSPPGFGAGGEGYASSRGEYFMGGFGNFPSSSNAVVDYSGQLRGYGLGSPHNTVSPMLSNFQDLGQKVHYKMLYSVEELFPRGIPSLGQGIEFTVGKGGVSDPMRSGSEGRDGAVIIWEYA